MVRAHLPSRNREVSWRESMRPREPSQSARRVCRTRVVRVYPLTVRASNTMVRAWVSRKSPSSAPVARWRLRGRAGAFGFQDGPFFSNCKVNAAPFLGEVAECEARHQ